MIYKIGMVVKLVCKTGFMKGYKFDGLIKQVNGNNLTIENHGCLYEVKNGRLIVDKEYYKLEVLNEAHS